MRTKRLTVGDRGPARELFALMAAVFEEDSEPLGDAYLDRLLGRADFWVIAAFAGDEIVGGVTAHTLPMTRSEFSEIFIYDIAVSLHHQRQGVGRTLMASLRAEAAAVGITLMFVPADNDDVHALDFYRALGGVAQPVTFFVFSETDATGA
jgi:aminoglycoside 3-N-acetyltransferase I